MAYNKTFSIIVMIILVFGILVGCARNQPYPPASDTSSSESTPLDQDMQALDDQQAADDGSTDTTDSDLTQLQNDLDA